MTLEELQLDNLMDKVRAGMKRRDVIAMLAPCCDVQEHIHYFNVADDDPRRVEALALIDEARKLARQLIKVEP